MSLNVARKSTVQIAVKVETTEGQYIAPVATDFIAVKSNGMEMKGTVATLERDLNDGRLGRSIQVKGERGVSASLVLEAKAGSNEGSVGESDALMRAAMGGRRQGATVTTGVANTASQLNIPDSAINEFHFGDIILVKSSSGYHVSPVVIVHNITGSANIILMIPKPSGSFEDNVVIAAFTTYMASENGHPSLSVSKWLEGVELEQAMGCRVSAMSLENFATGKLPDFKFALKGLDYSESLTAIPVVPQYTASIPSAVLNAKVYNNNVLIDVTDLSFAIDNTISMNNSVQSAAGNISSKITKVAVKGMLNAYKDVTSLNNYNTFSTGSQISIFGYAGHYVSGVLSGIVAFYIPVAVVTGLVEVDKAGIVGETISFEAAHTLGSTFEELFVTLI
jgi:hypothetical protein